MVTLRRMLAAERVCGLCPIHAWASDTPAGRQPPYAARSLRRVRSRGLCFVHARALDAPALRSVKVARTGRVRRVALAWQLSL